MDTPHIHLSALNGFTVMLYVFIGMGLLHIISRRYPDSALFNMIMSVYS